MSRPAATMLAAFTFFVYAMVAALGAQAASNEQIIRHVFGIYGSQAVRVAYCESRLNVWASNGQYLGIFQMGSYARARYGHGNNAWVQARAAYRYFVDSGRDWSPWACKPW